MYIPKGMLMNIYFYTWMKRLLFHLLYVANYLQQYTVNKVFYTCNKILNVSEILELVVAITTIPISVYQATIAAATSICCVNVNGSTIYQLYIGKTWFLTLCKYMYLLKWCQGVTMIIIVKIIRFKLFNLCWIYGDLVLTSTTPLVRNKLIFVSVLQFQRWTWI